MNSQKRRAAGKAISDEHYEAYLEAANKLANVAKLAGNTYREAIEDVRHIHRATAWECSDKRKLEFIHLFLTLPKMR